MNLIPKMQRGGSASSYAQYNILDPYESIFSLAQLERRGRSDSDDSEKGKLTEKDLFSLLNRLDALPNEADTITANIKSMYSLSQNLDSVGISLIYADILSKIARASFNKNEYDKSFEILTKNGGLNEVAITEQGGLVVTENGIPKVVSFDEYRNNSSNYILLTNKKLLELRSENPALAFDNSIFNVTDNGIGMETVTKQIKELMGNLGTDTSDMTGYAKRQNSQIVEGIKVLEELSNTAGADGIYKVNNVTKTLKRLALQALQYIYLSLPKNALNLLRFTAGDSDSSNDKALNLISQKIMSTTSEFQKSDIDFESGLDANGNPLPKGKTKSDSELKENTAMAWLQGRGYSSEVNMITGGNIGGTIKTNMLPITDSKNEIFKGQYLNEMQESGYGGILDYTNATMGGNRILSPDEVLLTSKQIHSVYWPTLPDGVTPDLRSSTIEAKQKADSMLQLMGIDPNDIENHRNEIGKVYSENGLPDIRTLKRFGVINGMTRNSALGMDAFDDTDSLLQVDDRTAESYKRIYAKYYKEKMDFDNRHVFNPFDWGDNYDAVYQGLIWIPVLDNYYNALAGTGEKVESSVANMYDEMLYNSDQNRRANLMYNDPKQYYD